MPKLKPSPIMAQAEIVQRNIQSRGAYFGFNKDSDFAKIACVDTSTVCHRRANPRLWTLEQLIRLSQALKCSLAWLMVDHTELKEEDYE